MRALKTELSPSPRVSTTTLQTTVPWLNLLTYNRTAASRWVDVSGKSDTIRTAVAVGRVILGKEAFLQVQKNSVRKGDVLSIAQIAGIMGAKETPRLIPLCHQVQVQGVNVELTLIEADLCS